MYMYIQMYNVRLFEIRRTERAENPTKWFFLVFCFTPEIGNATGMPE